MKEPKDIPLLDLVVTGEEVGCDHLLFGRIGTREYRFVMLLQVAYPPQAVSVVVFEPVYDRPAGCLKSNVLVILDACRVGWVRLSKTRSAPRAVSRDQTDGVTPRTR